MPSIGWLAQNPKLAGALVGPLFRLLNSSFDRIVPPTRQNYDSVMSEEKIPASGPAQSTPARFFYLSEFAERDLAFYHRALISDRRSIDATPQS